MNILEFKSEHFGDNVLTFIDIAYEDNDKVQRLVVDWLTQFKSIELRQYKELGKVVLTLSGAAEVTRVFLSSLILKK